mgnify:CR=1 FL=1|tara:strand:+ start:87 stop:464 length:378 start_codon:yes stop_codon:yes gene_type:complete
MGENIQKDKKWKFYISRIEDCDDYIGASTKVYADSERKALEKLVDIWNHGGNPEMENGIYEENMFLMKIVDCWDENGELLTLTVEKLEDIIYHTGHDNIHSANTEWHHLSTYPDNGFMKINVISH